MIADEHIPASVRGMDAVLHVTEWEPYVPGRISGPPELCYPDEGGACEWRLLSTTGRHCRRVEASLTDAERQRLDDALAVRLGGRRPSPALACYAYGAKIF